MKKFVSALGAVALAAVWTIGPATAQDTMKDKAERAKEKVSDKAHEAKEKVSEKAHEAKEKISDTMHRGKDKVTAKAARTESAADVRAMQTALKDKGHDPGPIDGKMGPRTSSALRSFQKAENLAATGRMDAATAEKLGVTAPAASARTDTRTDTPNAKVQAGSN